MNLLRELLEKTEYVDEDPSRLPQATVDHLKKLIREGCKPDKETGQYQPWANALQLVHKAYEVAHVQRPTPDMKELWKQYEEIIQFAVKELAKTRGIDGSWRMSAHEIDKYT